MEKATVSDRYAKRFTVELNPKLHQGMRELARRKRVQIGVVYEDAIRAHLERPENFMGEKRRVK